jgi:hypothetical protein
MNQEKKIVLNHERNLFCLPRQERFFPAFRAISKQIRAKQRPDRALERLHGCFGARFLRFRGKMAGVNEIAEGSIIISGKDEKGAVKLERTADKLLSAKSVWTRKSHDVSPMRSAARRNRHILIS